MKVNMPFNQLLVLIKKLSPVEKQKIRKELEADELKSKGNSFKELLLNGPVFTKEQIKAIEDTHKSINEWRGK